MTDKYFCISCDESREVDERGSWTFRSNQTVKIFDSKDSRELYQEFTFDICPYCIDYMKTVISKEELATLRWLGK
jgi:hypothetical protein